MTIRDRNHPSNFGTDDYCIWSFFRFFEFAEKSVQVGSSPYQLVGCARPTEAPYTGNSLKSRKKLKSRGAGNMNSLVEK